MTALALAAMGGRILLLGWEKIAFKQMGEGEDSLAVVVLLGWTGALLLLPFAFFEPLDSWSFVPAAAAAAGVYLAGILLYVRALSEGQVSLVGPVYNFNVFFLLLLSVLFLGESLSPWKVGGMALMVWGSTFLNPGVSLGASLRALAANRPCRTMMVASLFIAAGRVVDARVVGLLAEHPPTVPYALVQAAFSGLYALAFLAVRRRTSLPWRLLRSRPRACLVAGACNIYAYLLLLLALRGLEVSLAEPLSMLGILLSVVLAHFVFHEPLKGRLLGSCLMLLGAWGLFL